VRSSCSIRWIIFSFTALILSYGRRRARLPSQSGFQCVGSQRSIFQPTTGPSYSTAQSSNGGAHLTVASMPSRFTRISRPSFGAVAIGFQSSISDRDSYDFALNYLPAHHKLICCPNQQQ
jgi:hypothetical protein